MRLLIATGIYPPDIGGPATYSKLLFDELPKKTLSGGETIEVSVLSFGDVRHMPKLIRHIAYFFKVISFAREINADIIFAQDPVSVGLPALFAARMLGKKFLLRSGGDYAWEQGVQRFGVNDTLDDFSSKKGGYGARVRMLKNIQTYVAGHADRIILPSNYLKKNVVAWGIAPEKITVIYNSFEVPKIAETKEKLRTELGLEGTVLLSIGRLVPWKGFMLLIDLMPELRKSFPDMVLYIAGSGPQESALRARVTELGLEKEIILLGRVEHEKLLRYIKAADIFVLNTSYEGMSHQLLEVMALGTTIVTTNIPGNLEVVRNGESAILTDYNDRIGIEKAIRKLVNDPLCAKEHVDNARRKVASFGTDKMFTELVGVLSTFR